MGDSFEVLPYHGAELHFGYACNYHIPSASSGKKKVAIIFEIDDSPFIISGVSRQWQFGPFFEYFVNMCDSVLSFTGGST